MPKTEDGRSARRFITKAAGAANVTIGELVMQHGAALRLHTHPTDEAIILLAGRAGGFCSGIARSLDPRSAAARLPPWTRW